jgi:hypothetical protein
VGHPALLASLQEERLRWQSVSSLKEDAVAFGAIDCGERNPTRGQDGPGAHRDHNRVGINYLAFNFDAGNPPVICRALDSGGLSDVKLGARFLSGLHQGGR